MDKRLQNLIEGNTREHQFMQAYFAALFSYTAHRVPEIADEYYQIDDAMRAGYVWEYGPFEYWDLIGLDKGLELIESHNET
ncbi:MAG: 3-hydroxyacyl-CoA dehydrogenase family protein, partial [Flavobacteriaceae bacterium]